MKPFLKWAGGKRQLLPYIKDFINNKALDFNTLYEPFVGGGSVFLDLAPKKCCINDLNKEVINCYNVIKNSPNELILLLKDFKLKHSKDLFYNTRSIDRDENLYNQMSDIQKAARTIYLNKTCYNGLFRVNKKGYFNTPIGKYVNPLICDENNIIEVSKYLNNSQIQISSLDFEECAKNAKKGDLIYFDPPYDYETNGFVGYVKEGFSHFDLDRLKTLCDKLISKGCFVLISNNDTEYVRNLFHSDSYEIIYSTKIIKANRNISSARIRKKVDEVLIYGYRKQ